MYLKLLGSVRVNWEEGSPPRFRSQRTVALLGYLVAEGRSLSRDYLAMLFWPDEGQAKGKANLRREMYNLAQILPGCWQTSRVEVEFAPGEDTGVDIYQFLEYEKAGEWDAAAELIGGLFLEGVVLADELELEMWLLTEQERWRQRVEKVLNRLITEYSQQAQYGTALRYARQLVQLTPWNEDIHRKIMLMLAWTGQRTAALKQFEDCSQMLAIHLDIEPSAETITLHERILSGDLSYTTESTPIILPPFLAEQPQSTSSTSSFVARDNELGELDHFLQLTLAGQGQSVFVTGEAGSGKTTLLQEFVRRAQKQNPNLIVARGRCNVFGGVGDPYLPFREILDLLSGDIESRCVAGSLDRTQAERLWHLLPTTVQAIVADSVDLLDLFLSRKSLSDRVRMAVPPDTTWLTSLEKVLVNSGKTGDRSGLNQQDLFKQYTRVLQLLAGQHPLVLVLDDLQWVDPGSIGLLFHLGRNLIGYRILVIGLYRADEVSQGDGSERHPLVPLINEFQQRFGPIEVKIDSGNESFVEAYLESEPNRFSPEFKAALYNRTRGHALFTVEMMRDLEERGAISRDESGYWVEESTLDWQHLPVRIEAAIGERISRLAGEFQEILQIASVEGEFFTAEVVARVKEASEKSIVRQLSHVLDRQHRLVHGQESQRLDDRRLSRYSFHHILFQQYLYRNLDEIERVYLHEAVGSAMEALYGERSEQVAVQLARHFEIAGRFEKAVTHLRQAGRRARRLSAYQEAIVHFGRALALLERLESTPDRTQQEIKLYAALGYLHQVTKGLGAPEAEEAYGRAWKLFQEADIEDPSQSFRVQWGLWFYFCVVSDYRTAFELAERLWRLGERSQDPTLVLPGHRAVGTTNFWAGRFVQAQPHWEEVFTQYKPEDHALAFLYGGSNVKLHCLALGAQTQCWLGYPDQGLEMSQEGLVFAQGLSHPYTLTAAHFFAAWFRTSRRERKEAVPLSEKAIYLATEYGFPFWSGIAGILRVWALAGSGQVEQRIPEMQQALAAYQATGASIFRGQAMGLLAEMCSEAGRIEQGLAVVDEALAMTSETGERYWDAELHRIKGELLSKQTGSEADAEACYFQAISVAEQQQAKFFELRAVVSLCHLWCQQTQQVEAREKLAEIYNWFSEGFATPDLQAARGLLAQLEGN